MTENRLLFSPQNLNRAEEKFLQWEGVQTRTMFSFKEEEVVEWIEQITRQKLSTSVSENLSQEIWKSLSDGVILCILLSNLVPGSIRVIPNKTIDRVQLFLRHCRHIGIAKEQLFHPFDLIYRRNMVHVIYCLHSLAEICHANRLAPFFTGQTATDRKRKREEWKRKAKESQRRGFEGWNMSIPLLSQMKEAVEDSNTSNTHVYVAKLEEDIQQQAIEYKRMEEEQKQREVDQENAHFDSAFQEENDFAFPSDISPSKIPLFKRTSSSVVTSISNASESELPSFLVSGNIFFLWSGVVLLWIYLWIDNNIKLFPS